MTSSASPRFLSGEQPGKPCQAATDFAKWLQTNVLEHLKNSLSFAQIATLKWLLQDQWQAVRKALPASHSNRFNSHECVDEQYQRVYDQLHLLQLQANPPAVQDVSWMAPKPRRSPNAAPPTAEEAEAQVLTILGMEEN